MDCKNSKSVNNLQFVVLEPCTGITKTQPGNTFLNQKTKLSGSTRVTAEASFNLASSINLMWQGYSFLISKWLRYFTDTIPLKVTLMAASQIITFKFQTRASPKVILCVKKIFESLSIDVRERMQCYAVQLLGR